MSDENENPQEEPQVPQNPPSSQPQPPQFPGDRIEITNIPIFPSDRIEKGDINDIIRRIKEDLE